MNRILLAATAIAFAAAPLSAQKAQIPVVKVADGTVKGTDVIGTGSPIRAMSTGAVLVSDIIGRRQLFLSPTLATGKVLIDSLTMASNPMSIVAQGFIAYSGDSTLVLDIPSQSLLMLGPEGKIVRPIAIPKQQDMIQLGGNPVIGGTAGYDGHGRLVYRATYPQPRNENPAGEIRPPVQPDSAPIVRASFDTRSVDTIGVMHVAVPAKILKMTMPSMRPGSDMGRGDISTAMQGMTIDAEINPMAAGDEWALLSDGTIAIVRTQDYHVDWIDPDGKHRSSPKMPFEWRKATDEDKQFKLDSLKHMVDSVMSDPNAMRGAAGMAMPKVNFTYAPFSAMPDYHPPIRPGSVRADADNHLWILPTTSAATGGLMYDVVDREGNLFQRVQIPPQTSIAGFAKGGVVYLYRYVDKGGTKSTLERTSVTFVKGAAQ